MLAKLAARSAEFFRLPGPPPVLFAVPAFCPREYQQMAAPEKVQASKLQTVK